MSTNAYGTNSTPTAAGPALLRAYDATNLNTEPWNSKQNAARDDLGNFAKNPAPTVANGKVYLPTFSNKLVVYGELNVKQFEIESLTVLQQTAGITWRTATDTRFSGGVGGFFDATAATQFVTFDVPNIAAGTYDVRVGVKQWNNKGQWQCAISRADNLGSPTNVGPVIDEFTANENFTEFDLGNWTPGTTSDKGVRFMVTGKNASSTGFGIALDYIKFIPQ